mgnify:CR=1 FL=1|jgi:uncharacterized protein (DUF983 family)
MDPVNGGPARTAPSKTRMFARGATRACPVCGQRKLFRGLAILPDCPRCGLHFERIEGHWIGSVGLNTIVTFGLLAITVVGGLVATFPDFPVGRLTALAVAVSVIVPIAFHPSSRTLWTAIDIAMRPLEAHEVDWKKLEDSQPNAPEHQTEPERQTEDQQ